MPESSRRFRGPKTFRWRVFWSLIPIFLLLFGVVAVISSQQHQQLIEEEFVKRGKEMVTSLAKRAELGALAESDSLLEAAMGVAEELAICAIRVSLGWATTSDHIDRFIVAWRALYERAQSRSATAAQ